MHWLHYSLTAVFQYFGRHRIINDRLDEEPYLERYYLFLKHRTSFPFNIFLHRFLKSDPDDLHDHPWNYRTFILFGGYWEHTVNGKSWKGPLSYIYAPANTYHRLELDKDIPYCWTLFIPGRKNRDWGFLKDGTWVQHDDYLKNKKN